MSLLLAFAAIVAAQTASPPLTLREAQALAPRALATRVLGPAGSLFREARVSDGGGPFGYTGLGAIELASPPRPAGSPGLCVADIVSLQFRWGWNGRTGENTPRLPDQFTTRTVYRIVGDTNDRRPWTSETERALNVQCARTGPVFTDAPGPGFFGHDEGTYVGMAARMLQTVIAEARQGPVRRVNCTEDPSGLSASACGDPRAILAGVPVDRMAYVRLNSCTARPAHLCAELTFKLAGTNYQWQELRLGIEIDAAQTDPLPTDFRIIAVTIQYQTVAV